MRILACLFLLFAVSAPAGEVTSIMSVGDSISRRGHLQALQKCLVDAGITDYEFVGPVSMPGDPKPTNRLAYGGNTLEDIFKGRVVEGEKFVALPEAISTYHPDVILLMGGMNNIVRLKEGMNLNHMEHAWAIVIDYLVSHCPQATIFAGSVTPVDSQKSYAGKNAVITKFNAYLAEAVQARHLKGEHLIYVDTGSAMNDADFNADGLHPNPLGDVKIGQAWFHALQNSGIPVFQKKS